MKKKPPDEDDHKKNLKNYSKNNFNKNNSFRKNNNNKKRRSVDYEDDDGKSFWLNANEDAKIQIWPYKKSVWKTFLSNICIVLTLGFLRLVYFWKPEWQIRFTCASCPLKEADCILIR